MRQDCNIAIELAASELAGAFKFGVVREFYFLSVSQFAPIPRVQAAHGRTTAAGAGASLLLALLSFESHPP